MEASQMQCLSGSPSPFTYAIAITIVVLIIIVSAQCLGAANSFG